MGGFSAASPVSWAAYSRRAWSCVSSLTEAVLSVGGPAAPSGTSRYGGYFGRLGLAKPPLRRDGKFEGVSLRTRL